MKAARVYILLSLAFFLLTLALFVNAATGQGREMFSRSLTTDDGRLLHYLAVRLSDIEIFMGFFAPLLLFAGLMGALGVAQEYVRLPEWWKQVNSWACGFGVLGFAYWQYWRAWQWQPIPVNGFVSEPFYLSRWPMFFGGLLLLLSLALSAIGVSRAGGANAKGN